MKLTIEERIQSANRYYDYLVKSFTADRHTIHRIKRIGLYEKLINQLQNEG